MNKTATILQNGSNAAVVQLPDKQFPGVVIQGDSLSILMRQMMEVRKMVAGNVDASKTTNEVDDVIDKLYGCIALYEIALENNGLPLPYPKWSDEEKIPFEKSRDQMDAWYDGSAINVIAVGSRGDPLDLSEDEAIDFVNKINKCIKLASLEKSNATNDE